MYDEFSICLRTHLSICFVTWYIDVDCTISEMGRTIVNNLSVLTKITKLKGLT